MRYIAAASIVILLLAGTASAQVSSPISFYGGVGISSPSGPVDFSDHYKRSAHYMLGVGYSFFPKLEAVGKVEIHSFGEDFEDLDGGKLKAVMVGVDGKFTLSLPTMSFAPYVIGGIGLASMKQDSFSSAVQAVTGDMSLESQTRFYYDYGFGVQWKLMMGISAFGQLHWVKINTKDERGGIAVPTTAPDQAYDDGTKFWSTTVGLKLL